MFPNERIFHNGWSGVMVVWKGREGEGGEEERGGGRGEGGKGEGREKGKG